MIAHFRKGRVTRLAPLCIRISQRRAAVDSWHVTCTVPYPVRTTGCTAGGTVPVPYPVPMARGTLVRAELLVVPVHGTACIEILYYVQVQPYRVPVSTLFLRMYARHVTYIQFLVALVT